MSSESQNLRLPPRIGVDATIDSHRTCQAGKNSARRATFRRILDTRLAGAGLAILAIVLLCALLAPLIAPYDPNGRTISRSPNRRPPITCSAQTTSAATCSRASSTARASRWKSA